MDPELFYVGLKALIVQNGRLLMLCRMKPKGISHWDFPGGRMGAGENPHTTLIREIQEELHGVHNIEIGPAVHVHHLTTFRPNGHGLFLVFFQVQVTLPDLVVTPDHSELHWFTKSEVEALPDRPELQFEPGYRAAALKALSDA